MDRENEIKMYLEDEINQSMEDLERALHDINIEDEITSKSSSTEEEPSPDIKDDVEDPVADQPLPKRRIERKLMLGVGLFAVILAAVPIILFGLNGFSISKAVGSSTAALTNDVCEEAIRLLPGAPPLAATTEGANSKKDHSLENCGLLDVKLAGGAWFQVFGTGDPFRLVKQDAQAFTNQVSVYRGECGQLKCVNGDNLRGTVFWDTKEGESYYILVSGVDDSAGEFSLTIESVPRNSGKAAENDFCEGALGLTIGGSASHGTTRSATFDIEGAGICYRAARAGLGLWYEIVGDGKMLQVSTNDPATYLAVFSGKCKTLQCVAASNDATEQAAAVRWNAKQATRYYILAHSAGNAEGSAFDISVTADTDEGKSVVNDFCKGALGPVPTDGSIFRGSTQYATLDSDMAGECYDNDLTGNGIWLAVDGTSNTIRITPTTSSDIEPLVTVFKGSCKNLECVDVYQEVTFDMRTVVSWKSDDRETYYLLVRGTKNSTGSFELTIASLANNQNITVPIGDEETELPLQRPMNDYCDSAQQVPIDDSLTPSDTSNATLILDGIGRCHSQVNSAAGVWFKTVAARGNPLRVTTSNNSILDPFISVYAGDCESLLCIADQNGDTRSKRDFVWDTAETETYYILVQGRLGQRGPFELIIEELTASSDIVPHDSCEEASGPFPTNGTLWSGTTKGASADTDLGLCYNDTRSASHGVWYTVTGTGEKLEIISKGYVGFTPSIAIFGGASCGGLQCITTGDSPMVKAGSTTWQSTANLPYYILVHGGQNGTLGSFDLMILPAKTDILTVNDKCERHEVLPNSEDVQLTDTTENSSLSEIFMSSFCSYGGGNSSRGRWYAMQGTGSRVNVSVVDLSSSSTKLSVYSGSCNNPVCVGRHSNPTNTEESVLFDSQVDEAYYFYVHTVGDAAGPFKLSLQQTPSSSNADTEGPTQAPTAVTTMTPTYAPTMAPTYAPTMTPTYAPTMTPTYAPTLATTSIGDNGLCEEAFGPLSQSGIQYGRLTDTQNDSLGNCGTATDADVARAWYQINGTGLGLQLSTCTDSTNGTEAHVSVSVFREGCDNLSCMAGSNSTCTEDGLMSFNTEEGEIYHILISGNEASLDQEFIFVHNESEWVPDNCLGATRDSIGQLASLQDFYSGTGNTRKEGPLFGQSWLRGCDACSNWGGLDCNDKSQITGLLLSAQSPPLSGSIPKSIQDFKELNVLDLSSNDFSGEIPKEIGRMKKLTTLQLQENSFVGKLDREFGKMKDLVSLNLTKNEFSGQLPDDWSNMRSIDTIDLRSNSFSGTLPVSFGDLSTLQTLALSGNQFTGTIPSEIGLLTQLQNLQFHANKFSGSVPQEICQLRRGGSLESLTADCSGASPSVTCNCCTRCL